jgi:hypothetical protein
MSNLISRKALMDVFQEKADDNTGLLRNNMLFAKELVKSMPTAYDVDKVAKQLKEYERYVYDAVSDEDNYVIDTEKAIEIVKGAVKDE